MIWLMECTKVIMHKKSDFITFFRRSPSGWPSLHLGSRLLVPIPHPCQSLWNHSTLRGQRLEQLKIRAFSEKKKTIIFYFSQKLDNNENNCCPVRIIKAFENSQFQFLSCLWTMAFLLYLKSVHEYLVKRDSSTNK